MTQGKHKRRWLRWLARVYGSLLAGMWALVGLLSLFEEPEPLTGEGLFVGLFMLIGVALNVLAWRRERPGGLSLLVMAAAFSTFAFFSAGRNKAFAMLTSGGPFLVSGLLFLASARWSGTAQDGEG